MRGFPVRPLDYKSGDMASFINQDSHRRIHETEKENIWFSDPKLMHRNLDYSRDKIIADFVTSPRDEKKALVKAYDDIFKTNEWCSEFNYMLDVYNALLSNHLEGQGSPAAWKDLFTKSSIANEMKVSQLKNLLWKVGANGKFGVNGHKPNDSEVEFILIKI